MDAAAAYIKRMERFYVIDSAVAADDGNDGGRGWGGEASAPGGDSIARVNCQAVVGDAVVEEEEEEGAVDRDGDRMANSNRGPVTHSNRKDGNKSATPCTGRMTTTTAATATGGDQDRPAQGKMDHRDDGVSDCTDPAVAVKLGMAVAAVAAAAAAEAVGTAMEENGGGGNTNAEENLHL